MGRLAWSQVRFRPARALALIVGVLVAATAFTVLTAALPDRTGAHPGRGVGELQARLRHPDSAQGDQVRAGGQNRDGGAGLPRTVDDTIRHISQLG